MWRYDIMESFKVASIRRYTFIYYNAGIFFTRGRVSIEPLLDNGGFCPK